jgi:hypothetical protein
MDEDLFETADGRAVTAVTATEMRDVDRVAVEEFGIDLLQMMENAGRTLAAHVRAVADGPVVVLAEFVERGHDLVDGRLQPFFQIGLEDLPRDATPEQLRLANRVSGSLPVSLSNWFVAATLGAWGVVHVLVGYLRFERSDI